MSDNQDEVWLSLGAAARLFGASSKTMKRLLMKEQIPVLHLNGNYRVLESDVQRLKAERTRPMAATD